MGSAGQGRLIYTWILRYMGDCVSCPLNVGEAGQGESGYVRKEALQSLTKLVSGYYYYLHLVR